MRPSGPQEIPTAGILSFRHEKTHTPIIRCASFNLRACELKTYARLIFFWWWNLQRNTLLPTCLFRCEGCTLEAHLPTANSDWSVDSTCDYQISVTATHESGGPATTTMEPFQIQYLISYQILCPKTTLNVKSSETAHQSRSSNFVTKILI